MVPMKLNEFRLVHQEEKGYSLKTILKKMALLRVEKETALETLAQRRFTYFQLLPSPIGDVDEEEDKEVMRVYIPVDRMRMKWLDAVWFYPFVFWASFILIDMVMLMPMGFLGGLDIITWYSQFYPEFAGSTMGILGSNLRNAIAVWMPIACVTELIPVFLAYIPSKFLLSWGPSWLWNLTFGFYLKS